MHVVNELAEVLAVGNQEYEEVIEEYEEEILVPHEFPEPPVTDFVEFAPNQGKPRCITLIFDKYAIYIYIHTVGLKCTRVHSMYRMHPTCLP